MKQKFFHLLLIFTLLMSTFGTSAAFASNDTVEPPKPLKKRITSVFDQVISKEKEGKHHIDGMSVHIDFDYVVANEQKKKVIIKEEKPVTTKGLRTEGATIAHGIIFIPPERKSDQKNKYPGSGYVYTLFEVVDTDGPVGPISIEGEVDVNTSNTKQGGYSGNFANLQVDWNYFEISEGERAFKFTEVTNTKFYQVDSKLTVNFLFDEDSDSETIGPLLANKKSFEYPCKYHDLEKVRVPSQCHGGNKTHQVLYQDPYSDKVMFTPNTTQLEKVENPVPPLTKEDRGQYITEYIDRYGDPKKKDADFNWANYDIHHIIPREYGGTHDFDNLIPLKREFHQQNVTPWWTRY